jgi:hypothetical protein
VPAKKIPKKCNLQPYSSPFPLPKLHQDAKNCKKMQLLAKSENSKNAKKMQVVSPLLAPLSIYIRDLILVKKSLDHIGNPI